MHIPGGLSLLLLSSIFATMPTSTNYSLKGYDVGTGSGNGSSASYKLNSVTGTQTGGQDSSVSYEVQSGLVSTINSNVPPAPTFTNPSSYYDRLKLVIATGDNPSDTKFAIAISTDDFATTRYVKSDHSIGTTLTLADRQTYAAWGGSDGFFVLGLQEATTYKVKVKAMQGGFTETAYGPIATSATVLPFITFSVATTLSSTPPFSVGFTSLSLGNVFDADADASLALATNALFGGSVYLRSGNAGLKSTRASYTLPSATVDLTSVAKGYGAVVVSVSQSSGGPLTKTAPFDGAGSSVGGMATALQEVASTSAPVSGGAVTVRFKAKTDLAVPQSTDYADLLTFVAATSF